MIILSRVDTPLGALTLGALGGRLVICDWPEGKGNRRLIERSGELTADGSSEVIEQAQRELEEYFAGERRSFDVPVEFVGTDFQRKVWRELLNVGYGETMSYGELARRLGCAKAVRAVATAVGYNPLSVIVPCHRIIRGNGEIGEYAGGAERKATLLKLESEQ